MRIFVNGRFIGRKITGVQRYAHELTARFNSSATICNPGRHLRGWAGHLWEQTVLPVRIRGSVLWSPCGAGPIVAKRHVVTFHDLFSIESPQWYTKSFAAWYGFLVRRLVSNASHIIAVSEYTKSSLVKRLNVEPSRISVIHNGVDRKFFLTTPQETFDAIHRLNIPSNRYLLAVGSLEPRKNLARLLSAWEMAVPYLAQDLWLVVAGSADPGVYRNAGITEIPQRVFFTGYVSETHLPGLFAGSKGFVYPSLGEGFGLPPLEAMASGSPVLTSSVTSLPEVCASAALYCDPLSISDIATSIVRLANDEVTAALVQKGRIRAAKFTWDRTADSTFAVLERIAEDPEAERRSSTPPPDRRRTEFRSPN